jgi:hypothetical protein
MQQIVIVAAIFSAILNPACRTLFDGSVADALVKADPY